jgi:hypothetical protein
MPRRAPDGIGAANNVKSKPGSGMGGLVIPICLACRFLTGTL